MFNAELIAVSLADRSVLARPTIPDVRVKIGYFVRFFLPYPQNFVDSVFKALFSYGHNRKFFRQIVSVDYAEFFNGVRGCSVQPSRADIHIRIPHPVFEYIFYVFFKNFVCVTHFCSP